MIYRTICTQLWTDKKVQRLSVQGKLLFVYLITNPHTHLSGIYYLPKELITKETGLSNTLSDTVFHTLSSPEMDLAYFDAENSIVFVTNMFRYQGRGEKNERSAAVHNSSLHDSPLVAMFLERYPRVKQYCPQAFLDRVSDTVLGASKRCPPVPVLLTSSLSPSSLLPNPDLKSNGYSKDFEEFWRVYPRKVGKKKAELAWKKAMDRPAIAHIVRRIEESKRSEQWLKEQGQFIPHPSTWINEGRWDDEPTQRPPTTMEAFLSRSSTRKEIPT